MKRITQFLTVAAAFAFLACGPRRYAPIEVTADDSDLAPLTGGWAGEYRSEDTGRSGSITFTLQPGEASASGDVLMVPKKPTPTLVPLDKQVVGVPALGTVREVLTIHFVRKEGDQVIGMLDPYQDPECYCRVLTTFKGVFKDSGTIEGTFSTQATDAITMHAGGQWKVKRVKVL